MERFSTLARVAPAAALLCTAFALPCSAEPELSTRSRRMMSTVVQVSLMPTGDAKREEAAFRAAFAEMERVERVMNEWRPGSALAEINRHAGTGAFTRAPADLCQLLRQSLRAAERTQGLFDPSWAGLRELWKFGTAQDGNPPAPEEVARACPRVAYRQVEVRSLRRGKPGCEVRLAREGMALGFGGVAKGWAVDRAAAALRKLGFSSFLIQAGGDLYAAGRRGSRPWRVGIRDPRGPRESYFAELEVSDGAVSTSGDYERYFFSGGKRYHHLIDPRTCYPATASRSATIRAGTALEAEFLSKAAFIAGGQQGLTMAESWGAGAVLVSADNRVLVSKSLQRALVRAHPTPGP